MTLEWTSENFATRFRTALSNRAQSLAWLRRELARFDIHVAASTLTYWRSGERAPSGDASVRIVAAIEELLAVPAGELVAGLRPTAQRRTAPAPERDDMSEHVAMEETLVAEFGVVRDENFWLRSQSRRVSVGEDGVIKQERVSALIEAVNMPFQRITYFFELPPEMASFPETHVTSGGRVIAVRSNPKRTYVATVIELDDMVEAGQTAYIEAQTHFPAGARWSRDAGTYVPRPIRDLIIAHDFHPDAIPDWIEEFEELTGERNTRYRYRTSGASGAVLVQRANFGPGLLGMRWGYDDGCD